MSNKYVFVEHLSNLNDVIKQPLQLTQRLKFTCFDVSNKYIVFGASSGGMYIFWRSPCVFAKLIPNNEGSIVQLAISPDEKTIAFATSKGYVILLEGCFTDCDYSYQQFAEHEGNTVTAMKWHNSEVYCGDNTGKVSVATLANLLTKAIFQTPCATLMTLDSSVVQIDSCSKFLLVSTLSRTFLCDTEKEQYRQIGKKLRDGSFGACFVPVGQADVKIVCSRPGARLWQADFDATVTCTHHFKNISSQKPASIVHLDSSRDGHLSITEYSSSEYDVPELFNFGKLFVVARKFVLTYSSDTLYVIDPHSASLLFWSNYYSDIRNIKVVNHCLYIQTEHFDIAAASVNLLEDLILETLFRKQYFVCTELCVHFSEDVVSLISNSNRIHLITILKEKLSALRCKYLLDQILPILEQIKQFSEAKALGQKLDSGIVIVDNAHYVENKLYEQSKELQPAPDTMQILKEISLTVTDKLTEGSKNLKEKLQFLEEKVKKLTVEDLTEQKQESTKAQKDITPSDSSASEVLPFSDTTNIIRILQKHFELSKINPNVEAQRLKDLFDNKDAVCVKELLQNFSENVEQEQKQVQDWCYSQFLKYLIRKDAGIETAVFEYTKDAFINVNASKELRCHCGYPLPDAKCKLPEFFNTGCKICKHLYDSNNSLSEITDCVPYMWKYVLMNLSFNKDMSELLDLIVQFSDEELFRVFQDKFTYDVWDDASKRLVRLKKGLCLNCDTAIKSESVISWTDFACVMLQSLGGTSTLKLLRRYSKWIRNGDLDTRFYQTCIFSAAIDNPQQSCRKKIVNFAKGMWSEESTSQQMSELIAKYLHKKHLRQISFHSATLDGLSDCGDSCGYCDLPLNIDVLGDPERQTCSHVFHKICFVYNSQVCCICKSAVKV